MNEILDFVKAMSHPDRLRIIGVLSQKSVTRAELAARLELPLKEVVDHLQDLEQVRAISQNGQTYVINDERLAALAREKLAQERPVYIPAEELDEKSKKVLKAHLNPDGSIKQIPSQPVKLKVILDYLIVHFEVNVNYTEKEVNVLLRRFNEDTAGLRRELVDARMLDRESDGSRYWRVIYDGK
jgi:hypothetical protein